MSKESENFLKQTLDQVMSDRFGRYSKYIIQDRALPDVRDGLKPVQRRILFSMHELGLTFNRSFKKSARVVGDVIGKYHPHGDSSIYEAMVRMSQNWKMNIPLIEMHGNNGSIDDDPAAAMRYTEAKLSKISDTMLNNIKKETVVFAPNFDDSEKEPTVLPGLMPNLLVNGARGIAAGYATEMPPHNLNEVIDAIIARIKSPNSRLETLMKFIKGPDFPTGGIVQGKTGIYQAFERGRGRIVIRSKYTIVDLKTKPSITVTEIPYGVIKQKLVKDIDEIRFNNKIDGIKEVRDESDRNGITIKIELNPGTDVNAVLNYLLAKTELQVYYNYNNVGIKNKVPTQVGIIDLIDGYLDHQKEIQTKALNYELTKDQTRLEIVEGLIKVSQIAEQVINVIRKSEGSKQGVIKALINKFDFTQLQANAIAELRLYRLSKTDQSTYLEEQTNLTKRINEILEILNDENNFNNYLISILKELKATYGTERKTLIEDAMETITVDMEALIKHEDTWLGVTTQGYIKRFSNRAYEANNQTDFGLKESDSLQCLTFTNTANKALVFTSKGNYFFIPIHSIKEAKYKDVGNHLNDFAVIAPEEKITDVIVVDDFNINAYITQVTKYGRVKRTKVKDFEVARFSKTYKSFKLKENDEVIGARISNGFKQLVIFTSQGKAVRYSEIQASIQGTKSTGSKGISLPWEHFVTSFVLCSKDDVIGLTSKRGGAKRIKVSSIIPMSKSTQGKQAFREIKGNPHITTDARVVKAEDKIIFSSSKLIEVQFNKVTITKSDEGFSAVGPTMARDAKILVFDTINSKNPFLEKPQKLNEEEQFAKAEDTINQMDQLNIDDLLKDL